MIKVLLSISQIDSDFLEMKDKLSKYCMVNICDLENYSLKDYDIFIGKKLDSKKLEEANKLKCIFAYKTGVDDFPLEELKKKNIKLVNSHANAKEIGEYAFALSSSLVFHINKYDYDLRKGIWYDENDLYWESIFGLKVGILGYGRIGKEIHKIFKNNKIESYTLNRGKNYKDIKLVDNLEELVKKTDIIICSLPSTKETEGMFNEEIFSLMKGKYFVNVGRSKVVDEKALYKALEGKVLKGAAIDTWVKKPKDSKSLLKVSKYDFEELDNIILSPHAAMRTKAGHKKYVHDITKKIINYIKNNSLVDIVDYDKGY